MNAIEITGLRKAYPDFELAGLDLCLPGGCIMGLIGIVSQYWFQRNFSSYDSSVAGVTEPTITGKNVQNRFPESANIDAPQNITTINSTERQYFFIM